MNVPRGTLLIIAVLASLVIAGASLCADNPDLKILSESAVQSNNLFSTNSLTLSPFSCNINLSFAKKIKIFINYCNKDAWLMTWESEGSEIPNLIASSDETIVYDMKGKKIYQGDISDRIKFVIGLTKSESGYRFCNTLGFEKKQAAPLIEIDISSIINGSIERDKLTFAGDKGFLTADGVHEQSNIISRTSVRIERKSRLPSEIELSQRLSSSTAWRTLASFNNISTKCDAGRTTTREYKNYAKKKNLQINTLDEKEITAVFLTVMKDLGLAN